MVLQTKTAFDTALPQDYFPVQHWSLVQRARLGRAEQRESSSLEKVQIKRVYKEYTMTLPGREAFV